MNKIKSIFAVLLFISISALPTLVNSDTVYAAVPGCYSRFFNQTTKTATYSAADCNDVALTAQVQAQGKCFVGTPNTTNGVDNFVDTNCASFNIGEVAVPDAAVNTPSPSSSTEVDETGLLEGVDLEDTNADCQGDGGLTQENCGIIALIVVTINTLSAIAGIAIIGSIMVAGYQYMTARDNPGGVQKAKSRIIWAMVALATYVFMYTILNFLVPGGLI